MKMGAAIRWDAAAALVALGWVFGAAFLFMKILVDELSTGEVVFGRLVFGAFVVWSVLLARRVAVDWRPVRVAQVLALSSLEMVAPYLLIAWAEIRIDSGVAAVLISAMPLFTALLAGFALPEEPLNRAQLGGIVLGFAGVFAVAGVGTGSIDSGAPAAVLAVIGAALCYAGATVYARILLRDANPIGLAGQQLVLAALASGAFLLATQGTPNLSLSSEGWAAMLGLGLLSTGVGMLGFFWLLDEVGSVQASLVTYIVPVSGLVLGWAILGESIGSNVIFGLVLIAAGVTLVLRSGRVKDEAVDPKAVTARVAAVGQEAA